MNSIVKKCGDEKKKRLYIDIGSESETFVIIIIIE